MGITRKRETQAVKLVLSQDLAHRLRDLRSRAEEAGFAFDLEEEISVALDQIDDKLRASAKQGAGSRPTSSRDLGHSE